MANFVKDNDDLRYYLDHGIDWDSLIEVTEARFGEGEGYADPDEARQVYRDMLEMMGEFAAEEVAPHALAIDAEGVQAGGRRSGAAGAHEPHHGAHPGARDPRHVSAAGAGRHELALHAVPDQHRGAGAR